MIVEKPTLLQSIQSKIDNYEVNLKKNNYKIPIITHL